MSSHQRQRPVPSSRATERSYLHRIGVLLVLALVASGLSALVSPAAATADEQTAAPQGYIVSFGDGSTVADREAALSAAGATDVSAVPKLNIYSASLDAAGLDALRADPQVRQVEADKVREVQGAPDDPGYVAQWGLPQIGWDAAYGAVQPAGSATVAVLDTGVNPTDDLGGNLVPGASMIDGDDGTADPNGHGTGMASIIAAGTNNGTGIAGVGYAGVSVMPVKVLGADGLGQDSDIVEGVVYAADHGADVILMSFSNPGRSGALQAAADYAWSKGAVLVAATGNDGSTTDTFPAGLAKVVGVSATTREDTLWSGSNSGADTFLAAPGVDVATGSSSLTGTSASAAIVAGTAALVKANDPSASNGVVVGRLARNADPAGTTAETGNGRVNLARALADTATDPVVPQGVAGAGGPVVGPYVAAANNDAHIAPGWAPTNTPTTFSTLYRKTTGNAVQHVRITLPAGYTNISVAATAYSSGTWSTPVINQVSRTVDVQLVSGTGLAVNDVDWARIDVTATTPQANQSGNAADWLMQTFTNTAGTAGAQSDNPPVLIGTTTNPSATITFVDGTGAPISNPVLENDESAIVRVRVTSASTATTIKYTDIAVPTCFSSPTAVTTTSSAGGTGGYATTVTDGFIRMAGGQIPNNGFLTVEFTTTPNCTSGTYLISSDPSTNASNPPSGTNQSVSTTGGSLTVAAGLADLSITKTDTPDPVNTNGTLTYTLGVSNAGPNDASAVKVVDTLPAGTSFVSATGTNWNCANASGTVTCNRTGGNLAPGAAPAITITVTAPIAGGSITNSATVSSPNDNTPANNTATASTRVNIAPVAVDDTATTNEDTAVAKNVIANDTDADNTNAELSVKAGSVSNPAHGTAALVTSGPDAGKVLYTPDANYNGPDSFTYRATDGTADSNIATVNVTVNAVNDAPVATVSLSPTSPTTDATLTATATKSDPDADPVTLTYVWKVNGTVRQTTSGSSSLTDTFDTSASGNGSAGDVVSVEVTPNDGTVNGAAVNDSVTVANSAPELGSVAITPTTAGTNTILTATPNGYADADGDAASYHYQWFKNDTALDGETGSTLDLGSDGNGGRGDVIKVEVYATDGNGGTSPTRADQLTVANTAPDLGSVAITPTTAGTNTILTATPNGYADADGDAASYHYQWFKNDTALDGETGSTLDLGSDGNGGRGDVIKVEVYATDGNGGTSPTRADQLTVANTAPDLGSVAITPITAGTNTILTATPNGYADADGDAASYHYQWFKNDTALDGETGSTLDLGSDGNGGRGDVIKVEVYATDGNGGTSPTRADQLTVANTAPELAPISNQIVDEQAVLSFTAEGSDQDSPGDTLTYSLVGAPAGASIDPQTGEFTWTPSETQGGAAYELTVKVSDGTLHATRTFTVTVAEVNVAPVLAHIDDQAIDEETVLAFTATATDADRPANTLKFSLVDAPAGAAIDADSGDFTWTPNENQGPGSYTFTVKVTDNGTGTLSDTEEITVTVTEVNVAPVLAEIGNKQVAEETELSFTATATDSDRPANTLKFSLVDAPAGAAIDADTGDFTWTPNENQGPGSYIFTVKVTDNGTGTLSDTEEITVTVTEVNVAPVANADSETVGEDSGASTIDVLANDEDHDVPAQSLKVTTVTQPANGTVTITNSGANVSYTPNGNYNGTDTFTYTVTDNGTTDDEADPKSDTATVTISVTAVNDTPVANDDTASTDEDTLVATDVITN
ncbi:tandem-95 repeat protein, partial [Nocardioides astragali]